MNFSLKDKVLHTIKKYSMINRGEKILVGFSGGVDSTALVFILNELSKDLNFSIILAHLNHLLRGEESFKDEEFTKEIAENLKLQIFVKRVDIKKLKESFKALSIEEVARTERYKFFNEILSRQNCDKIATAHTADDVIENFFLAFLNGRGLSALSGIPAVQNKIIRPLIECFKKEIIEYLNLIKITPRFDSSNLNLEIPRNWVRNKLIPFIENDFKPFKASILNTINILKIENNFINKITDTLFKKIKFNSNSKTFKVIIPFDLKKIDSAIVARVIKEIFKSLNIEWTFNIISYLVEKIKNGENNIKFKNFVLWNFKNNFILSETDISPYSFKIKLNEKILIPELNLSVTFSKEDSLKNFYQNSIYLNIPDNKEIIIRSKRKGDKINLLNTEYSKSLKELFIDLKIPYVLRNVIPVIEFEGVVAGIYLNIFPIYLKNRISDKYRVEKRKKIIKLYFEEIN